MSAKEYIRTPEMMGTKSFRCFNCGALMIRHFLSNSFMIGIECRRCKARAIIWCKESIPATQALERKEMDEEFQEKVRMDTMLSQNNHRGGVMKLMLPIMIGVAMLAVSGCSSMRASGSVCLTPEFFKAIPYVNLDAQERCIGGSLGGQVLEETKK